MHARAPAPCIAEHEQVAALSERAAHNDDADRGSATAAAARTAVAAYATVPACAAGADLGEVISAAWSAVAERATGTARSSESARAAVAGLNRVIGDHHGGGESQNGERAAATNATTAAGAGAAARRAATCAIPAARIQGGTALATTAAATTAVAAVLSARPVRP